MKKLPETKPEPVAPPEPKVTRTVRDSKRVTLEELLSSVHTLQTTETDEHIDLLAPVVMRSMGLINIQYNAAYARIRVIKTNGDVFIWKVIPDENADIRIEHMILVPSSSGTIADLLTSHNSQEN